jgi:Arc/MetJ-type ribon-helix-helix transcriptional regulator
MPRHLDLADLPEHVARYAQTQVDAGWFTSIEDVLSAGVEALQACDQADQEWLAYARTEAENGFAALDRGEGIRGTAAECNGVGINDATNGVFLPATRVAPNPAGTAVHSTIHTNTYYQTVNQMLGAATTRAEAEAALQAIRQSLLSGGL